MEMSNILNGMFLIHLFRNRAQKDFPFSFLILTLLISNFLKPRVSLKLRRFMVKRIF